MVRAAGLEPAQHFRAKGFSYPATAFAALASHVLCDARFGVWTIPSPWRGCAVGAARLVSTPSRRPMLLANKRPVRLARDCHFTGFPEFEQFCTAGFPAGTQLPSKSLASTISPRPRTKPEL